MKLISSLAAVLTALALASATPAYADGKKGTATRTCKEDDTLVKLANGKLRCWEKGKALPEGAVVVEKKPAAKPAAAGVTSHTLAQFAQAAEACLAEANALSETPGQPGGFVGADGRLHFTTPNDELAAKCAAAGNAAGRPQRWK